MRIADILLEYDRDRARQALGDKLWKAALRDRLRLWGVFLDDLEDWGKRHGGSNGEKIAQAFSDPAYQKQLADDALSRIEAADPSTNKKYTQWMARQFMDSHEPKLEDIESTMADYMDKFHKLNVKRKLPSPENDINRYQMARYLYQNLDKYEDPDSDITARGNARKAYEDDEVTVIVPEDEAAACRYGRGTRWCTAATKGQNYFDQYSRQGPLYIIIPKQPHRDGEKYQFHFQSGQFMDENDDPVDLGTILGDQFPKLGKWFLENPATSEYIKDHCDFADDETLQKISDAIWEMVSDHATDILSQWESSDDYYYEWLRKEGYVDDEGDIDWDRAPSYFQYNDEAERWYDMIKDLAHPSPAEIREMANHWTGRGEVDENSIYEIPNYMELTIGDKMNDRRRDYGDAGISAWIGKNIDVVRGKDGPRVERVVRRERP